MNTKLELQFIDSLKRSNFDRLEFHENDENKIVGFSYYYVDLRYSNYKNYDLSDLILFREDGAKIIALDRFGITYKCHDPEVTKQLLARHFAVAYTQDLI